MKKHIVEEQMEHGWGVPHFVDEGIEEFAVDSAEDAQCAIDDAIYNHANSGHPDEEALVPLTQENFRIVVKDS